jgi:uncharacterized protein with PIN domain
MSAHRDKFTTYVEALPPSQIICEQCAAQLTQVFAEVIKSDAQGPYAKWRGHCDRCDKEMWSKEVR